MFCEDGNCDSRSAVIALQIVNKRFVYAWHRERVLRNEGRFTRLAFDGRDILQFSYSLKSSWTSCLQSWSNKLAVQKKEFCVSVSMTFAARGTGHSRCDGSQRQQMVRRDSWGIAQNWPTLGPSIEEQRTVGISADSELDTSNNQGSQEGISSWFPSNRRTKFVQ